MLDLEREEKNEELIETLRAPARELIKEKGVESLENLKSLESIVKVNADIDK